MSAIELDRLIRPELPERRDLGIGVIGAGFIVRDCQLPAYAAAGFPVRAIASRTRATAEGVAARFRIARVHDTIEQLLDDPEVDVLDVAVPPAAQPAILRRVAEHPRAVRGVLAQKPLAMSIEEAREIVSAFRARRIRLQVNQNMRYDQAVRAAKGLLEAGVLGEPVLATIEMRAIPHWMPWAQGGRSLATWIMSIHHLDTFRYWLGDPARVLASTRRDPRTTFDHFDGINLYILEYEDGARAAAWDDVWAGPAREGAAPDIGIRWRIEGTRGLALGTIGWPGWPERTPSTLDYSTVDEPGVWHRPRWEEAWFPDAFAGTMAGLLRAIEQDREPDISGRDNLKTLALCEAVLRGAREHRVTVPRVGSVGERRDDARATHHDGERHEDQDHHER
jgi:predicted dehydrogenase